MDAKTADLLLALYRRDWMCYRCGRNAIDGCCNVCMTAVRQMEKGC